MKAESRLLLAIDQGGHASRALVFDPDGEVRASAGRGIETARPRDGWVEHDAEALVSSVVEAIEESLRTLGRDARRVAAAGLATQRSTIVCWDRITGAALSPVISWQDRRAARWLEQHRSAEPEVHSRTGLVLSPHYGASKLRWCLDHLPSVQAARTARTLAMGPLASFLLFRLLVERPLLVDPSNASRTLLYDLAGRDWSPELLDLFGLAREALPRCVPSRHGFGVLAVGDCEVPLDVCTGDQGAALYAFGAPRQERASVNAGTGAFVQCLTGNRPVQAEGLLSSIVWQEGDAASYALEGTVNGAGSALATMSAELGLENALGQLERWADACPEPPLFLNGVSGLGAPYWVADFPSRFVGEGSARQKLVGVLESIVFLLQRNLDAMAAHGVSPRSLVLTGGVAASDAWCQRLADLSGLCALRPPEREATASGLAWLLGMRPASQPQGDVFRAQPNPSLRARYERWRETLEADLARADRAG